MRRTEERSSARVPSAVACPPEPSRGSWCGPRDALDPCEERPFSEYEHLHWWFRRRIPWQLWRYVALDVLRVMVLAILTTSLLYSAIAAYQTIRGGIQLAFIWPFLARTIAYPLYFSIPLSLLFGVTLSLGRMVSDSEVAAMRFHGASHAQIFAPVAALALAALVTTHVANSEIVPDLHYEKRNLQRYIIKQLENLGEGRNRTLLLPGGGGTLLVGAYRGSDLWRVEIDLNRKLQSRFVPLVGGEDDEDLPEKVTVVATSGRLEITEDRRAVILHLRGVDIFVPERGAGGAPFRQRLITDTLSIPLSFEEKESGIRDLQAPELRSYIREREAALRSGPREPGVVRELALARTEKHRRIAFTLSAVTFPLIGACFAFLLDRRSRLLPFFVANLVVIAVYYPLLVIGSSLGERGFPPWLALSLPNLALAGIGAFLLRRVLRQ